MKEEATPSAVVLVLGHSLLLERSWLRWEKRQWPRGDLAKAPGGKQVAAPEAKPLVCQESLASPSGSADAQPLTSGLEAERRQRID